MWTWKKSVIEDEIERIRPVIERASFCSISWTYQRDLIERNPQSFDYVFFKLEPQSFLSIRLASFWMTTSRGCRCFSMMNPLEIRPSAVLVPIVLLVILYLAVATYRLLREIMTKRNVPNPTTTESLRFIRNDNDGSCGFDTETLDWTQSPWKRGKLGHRNIVLQFWTSNCLHIFNDDTFSYWLLELLWPEK